jgi:hypothetical protein
MRTLLLRLALLAGVLLTLGGCADSPTQPTPPAARDAAPGGPVLDDQVQGCVLEGLCILEPVTPAPCDPWTSLHWCEGNCMTSVFQPLDQSVQSCPGDGGGGAPGGGGTPPPPSTDPGAVCPTADDGSCIPPEEEEEYTDICPQPILGKVATALVPVAGRNHEFKFEGPFWRVNPLVGRSPAWYEIPRPTLSKDDWWMAESGNIQLVCWGRWVIVLRTRTWVGTVYVQSTDLHVVMGPGHPDF